MTTIPQRDLRNHNAKIIDRVVAGESFVVTRDGVAVADVRPHEPVAGPPRFPPVADLDAFLAPLPQLDAASWLAETRSDDTVTDEVDDPWSR